MKILYVSTISKTVNAFLVPHIKMLIEQGHSVDIACSVERDVDEILLEQGCNVYNISFNRKPLHKSNFKAYQDFKKLLSVEKYDVIHTHTPVASAIARLACKNRDDIKLIYTAHGFHFYKGAPLKNWLLYYPIEKFLSRYTYCLITINQEDYNISIRRKFKAKQIRHVHGVGIDLTKFAPQTTTEKIRLRKEYGYHEDDFILFYAAELNRNKHQDLLIDVVSVLKNSIPRVKLLLAGNGALEDQYKRKVKLLGLEYHIEFLGYRNDIPKLLLISDVAVASSRREGLPVNVMEAMATSLPLVVTDIRGHMDLVYDMVNGFKTHLNDIAGFASAIEFLYKEKGQREKMGLNSFEMVQSYSIENVINEIQCIYDML